MRSYQSFMPGSKRNTTRLIKYVTEMNASNPNGYIRSCLCILDKYDKNTPGSDSSSAKVSYATKIAQVINAKKGGSTQYGNFYLGQSLNVNYLGRMEGMPGGSGMPPLNRF